MAWTSWIKWVQPKANKGLRLKVRFRRGLYSWFNEILYYFDYKLYSFSY